MFQRFHGNSLGDGNVRSSDRLRVRTFRQLHGSLSLLGRKSNEQILHSEHVASGVVGKKAHNSPPRRLGGRYLRQRQTSD